MVLDERVTLWTPHRHNKVESHWQGRAHEPKRFAHEPLRPSSYDSRTSAAPNGEPEPRPAKPVRACRESDPSIVEALPCSPNGGKLASA